MQLHKIRQLLQHQVHPLQLLQINLILFQQIHLSHLQQNEILHEQLQLNLKLVKRHFYICRLFQLTLFLLQSNNLQFKVLYIKAVIQVTDLDTP